METNIQQTTGIVKFISALQNYGFITAGGYDYFFSLSGFNREIKQGDTVTFTAFENGRGLAAKNIRKIIGRDPGPLTPTP